MAADSTKATTQEDSAAIRNTSHLGIFANRNFRLLFLGSCVSILGDQFTLVALPWLVLTLTGNPAVLGSVLGAMALPRAIFILIGGAIADRMSPRRVVLVADAVNTVLIAALAALVLGHVINIQMVYVLAVGIGFAAAFGYPAGVAILPRVMEAEQLPAANSTMMAVGQLSMLLGPAIAGFVIAGSASANQSAADGDFRGIGAAFSVDAASFLIALGALFLVQIRGGSREAAHSGGLLTDVELGLKAVWADVQLRAFLLYGAMASVFIGGALQIGLPMLASSRLDEGAASLGLLMTASALGVLVGSLVAPLVVRAARGRVGVMILSLDCIAGAAIAGLALVHSTAWGAVLLLLTGLLQGVVQVAIITWIQRRVSQELMGRTMSIVMFTFMGLAPISAVAAGVVLRFVSIEMFFVGAGSSVSSIALLSVTRPRLRAIEMDK